MKKNRGYQTFPIMHGDDGLTLDEAIEKARKTDFLRVDRTQHVGVYKLVAVVELTVTTTLKPVEDA